MNTTLQPKRCAELLCALAAPERLKIVRLLRDGPKCVTQIAKHLRTPPVNLTHHLTVLRRAGMVRPLRQGRFIHYSLPPGLLSCKGGVARLDLGCCRLEIPLRAG